MKKYELMNGDIVVLRSGQLAVVINPGKDAYLLFQNGGFEFLDDYYNDELVYGGDKDAVMQVFRPNGSSGFECTDSESPIYERDETWVRPVEKKTEKVCAKAFSSLEKACTPNTRPKNIPESPSPLLHRLFTETEPAHRFWKKISTISFLATFASTPLSQSPSTEPLFIFPALKTSSSSITSTQKLKA